MAQSNISLQLQKPIESSKLSKFDLQTLCELLEERINEAVDFEINNLKKPENTTDAGFDDIKRRIRDEFRLSLTVKGTNNRELYGTPTEVFDNRLFPENVLSFYANCATKLRGGFNYVPRNEVEVFVDFSPPAKFDFNTSPGEPTENNSKFAVTGVDATWCNGLFYEIEKYFEEKTNYLSRIHKADFWNLLFWVFGIPICFWAVYRLSPIITKAFSGISEFVLAAAYLYVFFITAHLLRALFWYARWIWPKVEFVGGKSNIVAHRAVVISLTMGLLVSVVYDSIKVLV